MYARHKSSTIMVIVISVFASAGTASAADERPLTALEKAYGRGVPSSPFLPVVYRYADALLEHGRDKYGPHKSGLLLSALDRRTLTPLESRPPAPAGIREGDRPGPHDGPLVGANPQLDQNQLRLLYTLYGLSRKQAYVDAADGELSWFLKNTQSSSTGLLPWGEHLSWNVMTDQVASGHRDPVHEFARPWVLWDKCFELAPDASKRFAVGLWRSQIADHETGAFNRHAPFDKSGPTDGMDFPRHAGFFIRTWAEAYHYTKDKMFLQAIDVLLTRYERKRHPATGLIELRTGKPDAHLCSTLSLAIDCDGASRRVPEPLATRLANFAACEDQIFCSLPHDLKGKQGFVAVVDRATAAPTAGATSPWDAKYGAYTTAMVAMMCVSRYENGGPVKYRDLIADAADVYLDSLPDEKMDAWPMTFGQAISLELAAFRATSRGAYHLRAFELGKVAVDRFWGDCPLPRASLKTDHYESITGPDTLALALVQLHLSTLHISAVRAPDNTIDR